MTDTLPQDLLDALVGRFSAPRKPGVEFQFFGAAQQVIARAGAQEDAYRVNILTDDELWQWVDHHLNLKIPRKACCHGHVAPFTAFADAYFARDPIGVWKASRGLGGKSSTLAALSVTEAITLGVQVTILGGSGEQSKRVLDYMSAAPDSNLPHSFWGCERAPRDLVDGGDVTRRRTVLTNGGSVDALMASQRSARGPHPQRVRLDEVDEMTIPLFNAALGQPMDRVDSSTGRTVHQQLVASSTWQHAKGTMTYVLEQAGLMKWPVYEWCYKESLGWWLTKEAVAAKKRTMPTAVWQVEIELQEPSPENRAIPTEVVERAFRKSLGTAQGDENEELIFEAYERGGSYATGGDFAKDQDWTIIPTARTDRDPAEVVAFIRVGRRPWPVMVKTYNDRVGAYPGAAAHDATGVGKVVTDYVTVPSEAFEFVGKQRTDLISDYLLALEHGRIVWPRITWAYTEHKFVTIDDLFGTGHLPDTIAAGALLWRAIKAARGSNVDAALAAVKKAHRRLRQGEDGDGEPPRRPGLTIGKKR